MYSGSRAKRSFHNLRLTLMHVVTGLLVFSYLFFLLYLLSDRSLDGVLELDWRFPEPWAESFGWREFAAVLGRFSVLGLQFLLGLTGVVTVWNAFYGIGRTLNPWWSPSERLIEKSPVRKVESIVTKDRRPRGEEASPFYDVKIHGEPPEREEK